MAHLLSSLDRKAALGIGVPVALLGCYGAYRWYQGSKHLPPGPVGLPIVGSLPWLDSSQMHLCVEEMSKKHGDIVSYRLGSQLTIAVCSYDLIRDLLRDDNYAARPLLPFNERLIQGCGIMFSEGEFWSYHRSLALRSLRDFGFESADSVELMVDTQLEVIFRMLESAADTEERICVADAFREATNGVIAQLTLNRRFERGTADFEFINTTAKQFFNNQVLVSLPLLFPFLDFIVRALPATNEFVHLLQKFHDFTLKQIRVREAVIVDGSIPECLCDVYILERRRAEQLGDFTTFRELQIIRVVLEFFLAGTDTTAGSLEWLFILMSVNPDIQSRVHKELDQVMGPERRPRMSNRQHLHYTRAVIEEAFRFVSIAALGVFHRAKRTAMFHGYRIPEGAMIQASVYSSNHDHRIWSRPNQFYPEHFLNQNGTFTGIGKNVPFLIGPRSCAGEGLARMEVFLIFSAIMQRFRVSLAPEFVGKEADILKGTYGLLRQPGEHKLVFHRR